MSSSIQVTIDLSNILRYENYLHAARMNLFMLGMDYNEALEFINRNDTLGTYEQMKKRIFKKAINCLEFE